MKQYQVLTDRLGSDWTQGDLIPEDRLSPPQIERLLEIEAITLVPGSDAVASAMADADEDGLPDEFDGMTYEQMRAEAQGLGLSHLPRTKKGLAQSLLIARDVAAQMGKTQPTGADSPKKEPTVPKDEDPTANGELSGGREGEGRRE